jgi:hypothetical protein
VGDLWFLLAGPFFRRRRLERFNGCERNVKHHGRNGDECLDEDRLVMVLVRDRRPAHGEYRRSMRGEVRVNLVDSVVLRRMVIGMDVHERPRHGRPLDGSRQTDRYPRADHTLILREATRPVNGRFTSREQPPVNCAADRTIPNG